MENISSLSNLYASSLLAPGKSHGCASNKLLLCTARFILSGVPFTKPTGAWAADQSGASSRQTDIYSLERILWSLAMLGEPHAEIFWSLPTQLHELGEENNETSTIYDHGLHPLPFAQSSGRGPPSELWRLMANIGKEDADGKPTASYICDALTTILQHYMVGQGGHQLTLE